MFEGLSERLSASLKTMAGKSRLTEDNIKDTLREVRMALLEADVALPVVKQFTDAVKQRAVGAEVAQSLSPGQAFLKIVQSELQETMGSANETLNLASQPPVVIMVAGLQGAGKTTSVAKLARYLIEREKKKVSVVSADVYRPAAIKQLETLAGEVGARFEPSSGDERPIDIVNRALEQARLSFSDVLLVDTAGRLAIDQGMMDEIRELHAAINPLETLFVVDAMTGQDAANTAKAFGDTLPLTGVILTKVDADTRGGAALSVRTITGKPIKFLGVGEKTEALDPFIPIDSHRVSLVWAICSRSSKTQSARSIRRKHRSSPKKFKKVDVSISKIFAINSSRCAIWAVSRICSTSSRAWAIWRKWHSRILI